VCYSKSLPVADDHAEPDADSNSNGHCHSERRAVENSDRYAKHDRCGHRECECDTDPERDAVENPDRGAYRWRECHTGSYAQCFGYAAVRVVSGSGIVL
jgi:hypothetical protein